jgi:signal transduction histidine kinase/HD-like signal output (HDOD) protein
MTADPNQTRRVDLILQQLDSLPTLSQVATKVLELTSSEQSRTEQVVRVIETDPALASRVLKLARCTDRTRGATINTIERAVTHLGFESVRSAVLAIHVFDLLESQQPGEDGSQASDEPLIFDREAFWHHSIAVSVLSEELVRACPLRRQLPRGEALLAGLLHDLGMLALHVLLPRSVDRACRLAEANAISLDQACLRVIGMATHTSGKRLAERWRLPRSIGDVIWLHGQRYDSLPDLKHRPLIGIVTLADMIARAHYIAPVGHGGRSEQINQLATELRVPERAIEKIIERLPGEVEGRAEAMGLDASADGELLLRAIARANQALGRMNNAVRQKAAIAQQQQKAMRAIIEFEDSLAPGDSVISVLEKVVHSAREYFGGGFFAVLHQSKTDDPWQLIQFSSDGYELRSELITPPTGSTAVSDLADNMQVSMQVMGMLPWLTDYLADASDVRQVRLLPLRCGWGVSAVLLHDRPIDGQAQQHQLEALCRTWGAAVAAGGQHEGARGLGEQLAEANRMLIEAQDELARNQALAALGEVVAGAAHEMNNPLTLISGRSQQLASRLEDAELRSMAEQIVCQSHRLSDMITSLRAFSEPIEPRRRHVDLREMISRLVESFQSERAGEWQMTFHFDQRISSGTTAFIDPNQMTDCLSELLRNATESKGCRHIAVSVQIEPVDDRLKIQVADDGAGLSERTQVHCFDPFFSAKPAGRQPGLGLSRARRIVEAHGGRITLENRSEGGAVATIRLGEWKEQYTPQHTRAVA